MFFENYKKLRFPYFLQFLFINFIIQSHMQFCFIHCVTIASYAETQSVTGDCYSETQCRTIDHFSEIQSVMHR